MAAWSEFERDEPAMARLGRDLLKRHQVAYLATIRADGGPRVHQVCPAIVQGVLYLSIGPRSPKLDDLRAESRYMLHFMCGEEDAEFNVRGAATEVTHTAEAETARSGAAEAGLRFTPDEVIFRLDIERADSTRWENFGTPQIRPRRRRWLAASDQPNH